VPACALILWWNHNKFADPTTPLYPCETLPAALLPSLPARLAPPHLSDEYRCSVSARASSLLSLLEEPSGDRVGPSSCSSAHARSSSLEARSRASVSC
jgi:hypothetical protein